MEDTDELLLDCSELSELVEVTDPDSEPVGRWRSLVENGIILRLEPIAAGI
jgi:hypothetical protein